MKSFRKKLFFLESVMVYVLVLLAITNDSIREKFVFQMKNEGIEETIIDPYKELNKKVALTFDDGPDPQYTPILLDGLKERNVKATFFVLGKQAEKYPELILRMEAEGHLIGNHTYSHLQLSQTNRKEFKEELQKTDAILEEIIGSSVQYVRPPYGTWDKAFETELNMFPVLWNIDPLDWCKKDTECMVRNIVNEIEENDIILMHDQYASSVEAALRTVDELKKQGYEFVTVDELFVE